MGAELFHADVDGQTDMTKLTVAFRNFANARGNCWATQYVTMYFCALCRCDIRTGMRKLAEVQTQLPTNCCYQLPILLCTLFAVYTTFAINVNKVSLNAPQMCASFPTRCVLCQRTKASGEFCGQVWRYRNCAECWVQAHAQSATVWFTSPCRVVSCVKMLACCCVFAKRQKQRAFSPLVLEV